jgi:hypothetical protein
MNTRFDGRNLLAEVAGKTNGISRAEAERSHSRALKALKAVQTSTRVKCAAVTIPSA